MAVQSLMGHGGHHGSGSRADFQEHLGLFMGALDALEKQFAGDADALDRQSYYAHKMYYKIFLGGGEDVKAFVAQTNTPSFGGGEDVKAFVAQTNTPLQGGGADVKAFVAQTNTPSPVVASAGNFSPPTQSRKNRNRRFKRQRLAQLRLNLTAAYPCSHAVGKGTGKDRHFGTNTARKGPPLINAHCSSSPRLDLDDCKDDGWYKKTDGKTDETEKTDETADQKADEKADAKADEKKDGTAAGGWCVVQGGASGGAGGSAVQRMVSAVEDGRSAMAVVGSVAKDAVDAAIAVVAAVSAAAAVSAVATAAVQRARVVVAEVIVPAAMAVADASVAVAAALSAAAGAADAAVVAVERARESISATCGHPTECNSPRPDRALEVVVPAGCKAGDLLYVKMGRGLLLPVRVPGGVGVGVSFGVRITPSMETQEAAGVAADLAATAAANAVKAAEDAMWWARATVEDKAAVAAGDAADAALVAAVASKSAAAAVAGL